MELTKLLEAGFALILVLCLIALASYILRKFRDNQISGFKVTKKRISIVEILGLNNKSRFVILRKDDTEYFLLSTADKTEILETKKIELDD